MASDDDRYVRESPFWMGRNEKKSFTLDTTPWGGAPTSPVCTLWDITTAETDVTATLMTGATTAAGAVITTAFVQLLVVDHTYLLEIKWTKGSEINTALLIIQARK